MKFLIFNTLFLLSINLVAQERSPNHMLVIGGGGEPEGDTTIFDDGLNRLGSYLDKNNKDWNIGVSFNGGHSRTERIVEREIGPGNTSFTEERYNQLISEYEQKLISGEIQSGDQLVLIIDTHGAQRYGDNRTHGVSTASGAIEDYDNLSGSRIVSLDRLQRLSELALEKNVNLGIVDLSCHSGATQVLANANTCVFSGSGPDVYNYADESFQKNLRRGRSLEDIFLRSRKSMPRKFSMLSSPVGQRIQDEIYPLVKKYLMYDNERVGGRKYQNSFQQVFEESPACFVRQESLEFQELMNLIGEVEDITRRRYRRLISALEEYEELRSVHRQEYVRQANLLASIPDEEICTVDNYCHTYSAREILNSRQSTIDYYQNKMNEEPSNNTWEFNLNIHRSIMARKEVLIQENPSLADLNRTDVFHTETESKASRVGREMAELYDDLYEELSEDDNTPNPCARIRF